MARPIIYTGETVVSVASSAAKSKLQLGSERRALVDKIIDMGGKAKIEALEAHYKYDVKSRVGALVRDGWLTILPTKAKAKP
jgi:hypothetical protein